MTREYNNNSRSRNRRNRAPRSNSRNNQQQNNHTPRKKHYNKSMILLKSTVYSLGIVLAVLVVAFFIIKNNQDALKTNKNISEAKCQQKSIKIKGEVDEIAVGKTEIILLTKERNGSQELIKLDKECLNEVSRKKLY